MRPQWLKISLLSAVFDFFVHYATFDSHRFPDWSTAARPTLFPSKWLNLGSTRRTGRVFVFRIGRTNVTRQLLQAAAVASELAMTLEGLSWLLSRLEADGMISRKKRSITFSQECLEEIAE